MSFSNPMHHDSLLHPVMQQALAPFAPRYRPLRDEQRRVLDNVDANIRMFEGYAPRYADRLAGVRADRQALLQYFVGEIDHAALPWSAKEFLFQIPADMLGS